MLVSDFNPGVSVAVHTENFTLRVGDFEREESQAFRTLDLFWPEGNPLRVRREGSL